MFYLSGNEFEFFLENRDFSIALTGKVPVSNKKVRPFILVLSDLDRSFTCQWLEIYAFSHCLTGNLPVSDKFQHSLTGILPVNEKCHLSIALTGKVPVNQTIG